MIGKSFFFVLSWLFLNATNYTIYRDVDVVTYHRNDTTHILSFDQNICVQDSIIIEKINIK